MPLPPDLATDLTVGDPLPSSLNEERQALNDIKDEVENRITKPSGTALGDLLVWDGDNWVTTETRFLEGDIRPEGNVSAPVGSRYMDKSGSEGAVEWVKAGGADSSSGWICMAGDTGLRNIASLVSTPTGAVVHKALARRVGMVVEMHFDLTMPNANGTWALFAGLAGFGPGYEKKAGLQDNNENANTGGTIVTAIGGVSILKTLAGKRDNFTGTWLTSTGWPAVLPGVPA